MPTRKRVKLLITISISEGNVMQRLKILYLQVSLIQIQRGYVENGFNKSVEFEEI